MDEVKITIIGAGIVGLAIAAELSKKFDSIVLLERYEKFGQGISSRNSEIIHSGIYYPVNSLKALLCVKGAQLLYKYCEKYSIPHARTGKLIVATEQSELVDLYKLLNRGIQNSVSELTFMKKSEISKIQPNVNALAAIHSPNTGIVDTHSLMKQLHNSARSSGVIFSFNSEVNSIASQKNRYVIGIKNDDYRFSSKIIINSSGLSSDYIAQLAGINVDNAGYRLSYCKGSYFYYAKTSPIDMLVYPIPEEDLTGLGIHTGLDLGGRLRFGPDTEYTDCLDYNVGFNKRDTFYESASKIVKGLDKEAFNPDMAGIRPKIKGRGFKDFVIRHESEKGLEGFINLIGIESPGLTAAPAIANYIKGMVEGILN